jgi:hypothetical protein
MHNINWRGSHYTTSPQYSSLSAITHLLSQPADLTIAPPPPPPTLPNFTQGGLPPVLELWVVVHQQVMHAQHMYDVSLDFSPRTLLPPPPLLLLPRPPPHNPAANVNGQADNATGSKEGSADMVSVRREAIPRLASSMGGEPWLIQDIHIQKFLIYMHGAQLGEGGRDGWELGILQRIHKNQNMSVCPCALHLQSAPHFSLVPGSNNRQRLSRPPRRPQTRDLMMIPRAVHAFFFFFSP